MRFHTRDWISDSLEITFYGELVKSHTFKHVGLKKEKITFIIAKKLKSVHN